MKPTKTVTNEIAQRIVRLGPENVRGQPRLTIELMRMQNDVKKYFIAPEVLTDLKPDARSTKFSKLGMLNNIICSVEGQEGNVFPSGTVVGYKLEPRDKGRAERQQSTNSIDIEVTDGGLKRVLAVPADFDEAVVDSIKQRLPKKAEDILKLGIGDKVANHTIEEISLRKGSRVFKFEAIV